MRDDAIATIEPRALTEDESPVQSRLTQERMPDAQSNPREYFKHIERIEVRFIIENVNKPFMPVDLRERIRKEGVWDKYEGEYVKSGDVKTTIAFEKGTAPTDGNTEELTEIFIDHMWNFVRELKKLR